MAVAQAVAAAETESLVRPFQKTPENVGRLFRKFWEKRKIAPMGLGHDSSKFVFTVMDPYSEVFEIGNFGGVVLVTDISTETAEGDEPIARPHILIWDKSCYGKAEEIRRAALEFMASRGIHRLIVEIDESNQPVRKFLANIGFNKVGRFRNRPHPVEPRSMNTILYDALESDLKEKVR